jgi:hypothetical protein
MTKIIKSLTRASYSRGGRTGYFFGSRVGYAEGGPIYSRLGTLSSGVLSAEQQLQGINASLQKAESDLGSDSPGGGSSLAGGPSFTSNFEDANNPGPGSNLLFGGSSVITSPTTPPGQGSVEEPSGPLGSLYGGGSGGIIKNTMAPREPGQTQPDQPLSSYGNKDPITGGAPKVGKPYIPDQYTPGNSSEPLQQTLTGQELVNNIQMRMQQRDVKMPSFNAYAQDVMKTGGYPTKQIEDYSDLDPVGSGPKQLPSAGGGLGSFAPGVDPMGSRKENPTGPLFNSLNRSTIGNGFYDLNKGLGSIL